MHNCVAVYSMLKGHFMATNVKTSPDTIARQFADAIRDVPAVEQLWLFMNRDALELWVITGPVGGEEERGIYEVAVKLMQQYPDAYIRPYVLNPRFFVEGTDMASVVRSGARRIELRR